MLITHIAKWRSSHQLRPGDAPAEIRRWLLAPGSLTRLLQQASNGDFRVRLLSQGWETPLPDEGRLLGIRAKRYAMVRQVQLLCNGVPWVYARTVIPRTTLVGRQRRFVHLGNRPLGAVLFADPSMRRSEVQVTRLEPQMKLHQIASAELADLPGTIWGRRSIFRLSDRPLLVSELFLPTVGKCPRKEK
ncbi:MAG TPA: chorismate lyase [Gammaproteobacteria bacterium]|nr:chorismate lyase [Gammaproteobacteria bacterium]